MVVHGAAGLDRIAGGDAGHDSAVLLLDASAMGTPLGQRVDRQSHAVARNDMAAQEREEARELRIARRFGDRAMEGEVLGDRAFAAAQGAIDVAQASSSAVRSAASRSAR